MVKVMFESSCKNRKSWNERQMRLVMNSKYLEQQIQMIVEVAMVVLRGGTRNEKDKEERF